MAYLETSIWDSKNRKWTADQVLDEYVSFSSFFFILATGSNLIDL